MMNKVLLVKHTHKGPCNARTREHTDNTIQSTGVTTKWCQDGRAKQLCSYVAMYFSFVASLSSMFNMQLLCIYANAVENTDRTAIHMQFIHIRYTEHSTQQLA
jgi:hypothetical protein